MARLVLVECLQLRRGGVSHIALVGLNQEVPGQNRVIVQPQAPEVKSRFVRDHETRDPCRYFPENAHLLERQKCVPGE